MPMGRLSIRKGSELEAVGVLNALGCSAGLQLHGEAVWLA